MYNNIFHTEPIENYNFLVTGGAGFIGSNIVDYLLKYGAGKVRVMDNFSTGKRENIERFFTNPSFELLEADIRDLPACKQVMEGVDFVLHQAALGSVPRSVNDPMTTHDVNVNGFLNVLNTAKDSGIKKMVYAASSSTYGDHASLPKEEHIIGSPLSPYAVTKYVNELYAGVYAKVYGFNTVGLRYFNVFGPGQNPDGPYAAVIPLFIKAALYEETPVIFGNGETSRDFTYVENAVQANIKALFAGLQTHEVFNVAIGERTSLNELWNEICTLADVQIKPIYKTERKGDVKHSLANISKACNLLNYQPNISLKEGLQLTFAWYQHRHTSPDLKVRN